MLEKTSNTLETLFKRWTRKMQVRPGASDETISEFQRAARIELPADYLAFLRWSNGAEGDIGRNYLSLRSVEDIVSDPYPYEEFVPGLLFIAGDGAAGLFAFDTRVQPMPIVITHTDDLELDGLVVAAPSFTAFIEFLTKRDWIKYWYDKRSLS